MNNKEFIQAIGFQPKENASDIFIKKYNGYSIEINFDKKSFDYGSKIKAESKTTQNFSQAENWVVLECVDRLLEKGYKPEDITLEKTFKVGHGASGGRLDILVEKDGKAFLMIECKTYGKEYDKELKNLHKNGGQLFTYFQNDRNASLLMLYASDLIDGDIVYNNTIVNIEPEYRETSNVKDLFDRWNKLPKNNGVFDTWVQPYGFESKALTIDDLVEIKSEDSGFIFNRFLEILRHNVVSDKGNAFNRIFTLFLCKIYDEKVNKGTKNELGFQWLEGKDDHRSFQLRLTELYSKGMHEFLEKVVTDFSETEFKNKFPHLSDELRDPIIEEFRKVRLEKNNEFAIKDVYDAQSFEDNAVVVKEIVELLQGFKVRYTKKQQYLSDFFELLLTTGLKQESGQFFTPVPIAQYVIKSLPIDKIVEEKLSNATVSKDELLPYVMDYAAGSGHFLTETMHIIQNELNQKDDKNYHDNVAKYIRRWKDDHFDWAIDYVYGIEKDYRLVKVGKVGCYLHGDGLANVIHTDGLAKFGHPDYKGKLLAKDATYTKENKQFDIIVSNPPYSVSAFKNVARKYYTEDDFDIYNRLTDQSSEIECLFIERTKQLLKDGGVAGIILPSSILSNTGIYTEAREIILKYFDILGITELGSNTFMATGTNTVVLFLRRRSNYFIDSLEVSVEKAIENQQNVTLNGIENALSKYVSYVWGDVTFDDYKTLLNKEPNQTILEHEIYQEYKKKIKAKKEDQFWQKLLELEQEKLLYFVLTQKQKVVVVKTGQKKAEKQFLGYEFSNRRGNEGIHPIQRGKEIHECTSLFDEYSFTNEEKASTYNYLAFADNNFDADIPETLKENISYYNLVDMLTFDRVDFEKNISLSAKKKVKIESKWDVVKLGDVVSTQYGFTDKATNQGSVRYLRITDLNDNGSIKLDNEIAFINPNKDTEKQFLLNNNDIVIARSGSVGKSAIYLSNKYEPMIFASYLIRLTANTKKIDPKYLFNFTKTLSYWNQVEYNSIAVAQPNLNAEKIKTFKIPLPPLKIQEKIVCEIEVLELQEEKAIEEVERLKKSVFSMFNTYEKGKISDICQVSKLKLNPQENKEKQYIYLGLEHIESNTGKILSINKEKGSNIMSTKNVFKKGDILYGKLRPYLNKVFLTDFDGICSTDILVLNTEFPLLLKYILLSDYFVSKTEKMMKGVNLPRIGVTDFMKIEIPLPPLSEQQKIVAKIEKIEAQIEALENQIADIPNHKEAILKKYL